MNLYEKVINNLKEAEEEEDKNLYTTGDYIIEITTNVAKGDVELDGEETYTTANARPIDEIKKTYYTNKLPTEDDRWKECVEKGWNIMAYPFIPYHIECYDSPDYKNSLGTLDRVERQQWRDVEDKYPDDYWRGVAYDITQGVKILDAKTKEQVAGLKESELKESTDDKEWEAVCKAFCKKIGAELLFVNNDNFGYETKDGQLVHLYADELEQMLKKIKSGELKESVSDSAKSRLSELAFNFCDEVANDDELEYLIDDMIFWLGERRRQTEEIAKEEKATQNAGDRYQVRKYDKVGAPYGIYDMKDKKFVSKGEKIPLEKEVNNRNLKDKKERGLTEFDELEIEQQEHYPGSDIDHFIVRGNKHIPVRKGETDDEVLRKLSYLGNLQYTEPTDEEKASGKYISELYSANNVTPLCGVKWVKNPDYVEPENKQLGESEEGNNNADRIVREFTKSKRDKETYKKALNLISQLEWENHIDREKYDECIKALQDLFNKRNRSIKESAYTTGLYRVGQDENIESLGSITNDELHYRIVEIELNKRVDTAEPKGSGPDKTSYILTGYVEPDPDFYKTGGYVGLPVTYDITEEDFDFNPSADIPYDEEEELDMQLYDAVEEDFENLKNQVLKNVYDSQVGV